MQERYEIRGKLGQGGIGTVYRAWDHSLNREVAIKRILTVKDDDAHKAEATRQMTQETGALAAIQHPHIVTIYDVGTDEDGPFVVMELLKGQTIDEIVEAAPLTWADFREFVLQVQEGLVAAQDLGLVHRDLKPTNLMLNWLPSGKFQVKIVDFGLAKFSQAPSIQTVDHNDSIYGSIFFMAPEQFERNPLDSRTDMYAIGCVYYFALAGVTPFQGDTGPQVMAAHLEHRVVPLAKVRPDLPGWVCEWVMWHINRRPENRPKDAREALRSFIELNIPVTQSLTATAAQPAAETAKRPRLLIPGTEAGTAPQPPVPAGGTARPEPPITQAMPKPLQPPSNSPPSIHTTSLHANLTAESAPDAPPPAAIVRPGLITTSIGARPVAGSSPPAPTSRQVVPLRPAAPAASQPPQPVTVLGGRAASKKGLSSGAKTTIAAMLGLLVILAAVLVINKISSNKANDRYNRLVLLAGDPNATTVPVSRGDLELLLNSTGTGTNKERPTVYKALFLAKATDGTDVDARIAEFATTKNIPAEVREVLLRDVLRKRGNRTITPFLITYVRDPDDPRSAEAALKAVAVLGGDEHLGDLINLIQTSTHDSVRRAAEAAVAEILKKSKQPEQAAGVLAAAYEGNPNDDTRRSLLRLLGAAGGDQARALVTKALKGGNTFDSLSAIEALRNWTDDSMFETLVEFLSTRTDDTVRPKVFDAAYTFLMDQGRTRGADRTEAFWKLLAENAKTSKEQLTVINGLANRETDPWAISLVEGFFDRTDSDDVKDRSEKAVAHMKDRAQLKGGR